jgi:hypothetical protein
VECNPPPTELQVRYGPAERVIDELGGGA